MESSTCHPLTVQIVGLGGQGVVLAGDILAEAALLADFNVKKSEIHGLSRRYGSVSCQIRFGDLLHSPLCGHGDVDILLACEGYEGLKHLPFLKPDGRALMNRLWRKPNANSATADQPPEFLPDPRIGWFPGTDITLRANAPRSVNIFMLGVISTRLDIPADAWEETILTHIKPKAVSINLEIFQAGRRAAGAATTTSNGIPIAPHFHQTPVATPQKLKVG